MNGVRWAFEPPFAALYSMFLGVVGLVTIANALRLSSRVLGGFRSRRISLLQVLEGSVSAELLARAALCNGLARESLSDPHLQRVDAESHIVLASALSNLQMADGRFNLLWQYSQARVTSTKRLLQLTLIASGLVTVYGLFPTWDYFFVDGSITGAGALARAGQWIAARLTLGLAIAAGVCAVHALFENVLNRRLADWKYFHAIAQHELSRRIGTR
jgi:hypothetical protein